MRRRKIMDLDPRVIEELFYPYYAYPTCLISTLIVLRNLFG